MKRKRILVVDDEVYILHILEFSLAMEDYDVLTASSGEQALQKIEEERPDLVVLDILMPGMDGFEVCRRVKTDERLADIPIIFLSAKEQRADRAFGLSLGASAYISKPFSPQKLIEEIQAVLERSDAPGEEAVGM